MNDYPVRVRFDHPSQSSRGWAVLTILLIKFLGLIPPRYRARRAGDSCRDRLRHRAGRRRSQRCLSPGLFDFPSGYVRWHTRVGAFLFSLTDRYPPFSLQSAADYPVDVEVEYPEDSSKVLAALSLLFVVLALLGSVFFIGYLVHTPRPRARHGAISSARSAIAETIPWRSSVSFCSYRI